MPTASKRKEKKSIVVGRGKSPGMRARELGKLLEKTQREYEKAKKEEVINLRVTHATKSDINTLAEVIGVSTSNMLLLSYFQFKNNLLGRTKSPKELQKRLEEAIGVAKETIGTKRRKPSRK